MKRTLIIGTLLLAASPAFSQVDSFKDPLAPYGQAPLPLPRLNQRLPETHGPGTEQALRHQIESLEAGQADYHAMSARLANLVRYHSDEIQAQVRQWGALISLKRQHGTPGWGVYEATFEHARVQWRIEQLRKNGDVTGLSFETLSRSASAPS